MARLAVAAGLGNASDDHDLLSTRFVEAVFALRDSMNMTTHVRGLDDGQVGEIATRALNECHGDSYKFSENPMGYIFDTGCVPCSRLACYFAWLRPHHFDKWVRRVVSVRLSMLLHGPTSP